MMVVASVLVHLIIGCVMGVSVGVRMKALEGPRYVVEGGNVSLTCRFDLEGDALYSVLWWHDGSVLLRYTVHYSEQQNGTMVDGEDVLVLDPISNVTTRPLAWFPIQGVQAQLGPEGEPEQVWLLEVGQEAAGVYTCEVTTEAPPTFLTANASITLHVVGKVRGRLVRLG
ncbi:uncharacterized protein LOC121873445 [Homarus americanus]|uniref:uncharacterized protein LOC121873445 n=1 Tax=Homarus americanus TaxID=6706 RepID=UPI001C4385F6|nr:uncharacterized protein LOC121873445 [Homarus americanus]